MICPTCGDPIDIIVCARGGSMSAEDQAAAMQRIHDLVAGHPLPPIETQRHIATRTISARHDSRCKADERHAIEPGDRIGFVDGLGWCCDRCIR